jgi:hypothetical protein
MTSRSARNARPWVLIQFAPLLAAFGLLLLVMEASTLVRGLGVIFVGLGVAAAFRAVALFRKGPEE